MTNPGLYTPILLPILRKLRWRVFLSVETCKKTIRNQRDPEFPAVPALLQDLIIEGDWHKHWIINVTFFLTMVLTLSQGLLPSHLIPMLQLLFEARSWMMDGNFAMASPLFSQLYAVRVPLGESTVAVAFAFLQHKMQSTYEELFQGTRQ